MSQDGRLSPDIIYALSAYLSSLSNEHLSKSYTQQPPGSSYQDSSQLQLDNSLISSVLKRKTESLTSLLQHLLQDIQKTQSLEALVIGYIDANILKVENHLHTIDFLQEHNLRGDIIPLKTQMQQQLFQLEREKVSAKLRINEQLLKLSQEQRSLLRELSEIETNKHLFSNGGSL